MSTFDFRTYIEDKYRGQIVQGPFQNTITVEDIKDLRFENLELEDQRLSIQNGWAFAMGNTQNILESTEFRGYLFRPKQRVIWFAPEHFVYFMGAYGSSKTTLACLRAIMLCTMYPGTKGLIMRETYHQLETTTIATLFEVLGHFGFKEEREYHHHKTAHKIEIFNRGSKPSEIHYMPAKDENATIEKTIEDLQSYNIDFGICDEPANFPKAIFNALQARRGRLGVIPNDSHCQIWLVGNPIDEGHYLYSYFFEKQEPDGKPLKNKEEYFVVTASTYENKANLRPSYISQLEAMPDYLKRKFLYGEPGFIPPEGLPVYPNWNYDLFVSKEEIPYNPALPVYRGFDIGPTDKFKAVVCCQISFRQILYVMFEILYDRPGLQAFGEYVIRACQQRFPGCKQFIDIADPAAFHEAQTDQKSAYDILRRVGITLKKGESAFNVRQDAVVQVMNRIVDGTPGMLIDGVHCKRYLLRGFQGMYRYQEQDSNEGRIGHNPIKNLYSHVHNALEYCCSRLSFVTKKSQREFHDRIKRRNPKAYGLKQVKNLAIRRQREF